MFKRFFSRKKKRLKTIGYWQSDEEPRYPNPLSFEDRDWGEDEKKMIADYVKSGEMLTSCRGRSWCRFGCGHIDMGSKDLTDGEYVWPEGFAHYIECHHVKPPEAFIEKCKKHEIDLNEDELENLEELFYQQGRADDWWIALGKQKKINEKVIKFSSQGKFNISNFEKDQFQGIIKFLKKFKAFRSQDESAIKKLLEHEKTIEIITSQVDMNQLMQEGEALNLRFEFSIEYVD